MPREFQDRIRGLGFGPFMEVVCSFDDHRPRCVLRGLCERFWDTTNTFHFPFGEMTITPEDFGMLTGLRCGDIHVDYHLSFHTERDLLRQLFGEVIEGIPEGNSFPVEILLKTLERRSSRRKHEPDQLVRVFLAAMLAATIFADRGSNCYFHYLVNLTSFDLIPRYNWVSAGLATLFRHLRAAPRKADNFLSLGGLWKVVEVCSHPLIIFLWFNGNLFAYLFYFCSLGSILTFPTWLQGQLHLCYSLPLCPGKKRIQGSGDSSLGI